MPMPFEDAVITNGGIELLTKAQAGECKIAFTRMAIGNGEYTDAEKTTDALQQMTNLKKLQNSYSMASVSVSGKTTVKLTALLTNEDPSTGAALITEGYYINEIGVFAKEAGGADSTEVLYSIAVTSDGQGDFMPAYNGSNPAQITQYYFATVDNSADVTIIAQWETFYAEYEADTETLILMSPTFISGSEGGDGGSNYVLPTATSSRLGGIRIGSGLTVANDGTASVDFSSLADDPETSAAVVEAGTEEMTQEEIDEAYNAAE